MDLDTFAERYLIPPNKATNRRTFTFVKLCLAATAAAIVAGTMTLAYGYQEYAIKIYLAALTIPVAFLFLRFGRTTKAAGHYLTANIFVQIILFAVFPAVGAATMIGLAAGTALFGTITGRLWLGAIIAYCLYVAYSSPTEIESATAIVSALVAVIVHVIVFVTERMRHRTSVRAQVTERQSSNQIAVLQQLIADHFDGYLQVAGDEIIASSHTVNALLGYESHQFIQNGLRYYLHPEEASFLDMLGPGKPPSRSEIRMRHADGRWVWLEVYSTPDLLLGNPSRSFLVVRNYDNQRKVSDQLLQAQRLESMGTVSAAVAHDFNNMLTVILGLTDELPDNEIKTDIAKVASNAAALTNKLLTFGHGQRRSSEIHDLSHLMSELSLLIQHSLDSRYVLYESYIDDPTLVRIEESQIEQVLMNLVNNAREAMPDGGELEVTMQTEELDESHHMGRPGDYAVIEVRDTGHGMDEATQEKIFDPFFSTKSTTVNSGLGLSSCYGIVSQYGGFIEIESQKDQGTVIKVYLPIAETRNYEPIPHVRSVETSILIVDDDPGVVRVVKRALLRAGYKVSDFTDTNLALDYFTNNQVSLLVTDVVMPKMSGAELIRRARAHDPRLPVLFVSGFTNEELDSWQQDEITSFLAKPFRGEEVVARVAQLLGPASKVTSADEHEPTTSD